jgi:hypothetical protein
MKAFDDVKREIVWNITKQRYSQFMIKKYNINLLWKQNKSKDTQLIIITYN